VEIEKFWAKLNGTLFFEAHLHWKSFWHEHVPMEQHALKNVNNCLNTNIYSNLETSGGQISNIYLNEVHFFNASVN